MKLVSLNTLIIISLGIFFVILISLNTFKTKEGAATTATAKITGGERSTDGDYSVFKFTTSGGKIELTADTEINFLLIGGGGSGGPPNNSGNSAPGGGGGGQVYQTTTPMTLTTGTYTITVGSGGLGVDRTVVTGQGNDGLPSKIANSTSTVNIIAPGGKAGKGFKAGETTTDGKFYDGGAVPDIGSGGPTTASSKNTTGSGSKGGFWASNRDSTPTPVFAGVGPSVSVLNTQLSYVGSGGSGGGYNKCGSPGKMSETGAVTMAVTETLTQTNFCGQGGVTSINATWWGCGGGGSVGDARNTAAVVPARGMKSGNGADGVVYVWLKSTAVSNDIGSPSPSPSPSTAEISQPDATVDLDFTL